MFIRPKILRDADATENTSESKYNEVREEEKKLGKGHINLLPGEKQPVIPVIPPKSALPRATAARPSPIRAAPPRTRPRPHLRLDAAPPPASPPFTQPANPTGTP